MVRHPFSMTTLPAVNCVPYPAMPRRQIPLFAIPMEQTSIQKARSWAFGPLDVTYFVVVILPSSLLALYTLEKGFAKAGSI